MKFLSIGAGCQSVLDVPQCWMSLSAGCPLTISAGSFSVVCKQWPKPSGQSVTNIIEYSNILVTNIYSDFRSYQFFFCEYIRTFVRVKFVCTNIFGHSLVSVLECKT